jgi:hypothetical protein
MTGQSPVQQEAGSSPTLNGETTYLIGSALYLVGMLFTAWTVFLLGLKALLIWLGFEVQKFDALDAGFICFFGVLCLVGWALFALAERWLKALGHDFNTPFNWDRYYRSDS